MGGGGKGGEGTTISCTNSFRGCLVAASLINGPFFNADVDPYGTSAFSLVVVLLSSLKFVTRLK